MAAIFMDRREARLEMDPEMTELGRDFERLLTAVRERLAPLEWAEDEIERAQRRHGEVGNGPIWKAFKLLRPPYSMPEPIFRAHCRELLDRVAHGEDTRPATDAEMMYALSEVSLATPLPGGASCLYMRLIRRAWPEKWDEEFKREIDLDAYEHVHGRAADDYEMWLRHKLTQPRRRGTDS
jgi:hypothetical protein